MQYDTKSAFNSMINSQSNFKNPVMDCFPLLRSSGTPQSPLPFKQDLLSDP
ncbi:unknown protein [Microcystis aeruginosa NIES-843]|uniref:Uncharacterized protein n=1 Tax=Microcystis aeruginosa (strain NIES-843 / IAM M-2473) TaxID=449447 RepID=B0JLV6_MICAN|nr:unknown protein [Microcystis aeruginosa NIES-843]